MAVAVETPTFDEFAARWYALKRPQLTRSGRVDYETKLGHVCPFFGPRRVSEITVADLDRYRQWKMKQGRLAPSTINRTLDLVGLILDLAHEYGLIEQNPMRVNRPNRKLKVGKPTLVWLDRAEHVTALLDAAGELDRLARSDRVHVSRRAILATFVFAGLDMGELLALRWRDVDFDADRIDIRSARPHAVDLLPPLRDELLALRTSRPARGLRATRRVDPKALVFLSATGRPLQASNIRRRVLAPAVERANVSLRATGAEEMADHLTAQALRRTFASMLIATGVDFRAVQDQLGHSDPTQTLRVWNHAMRRDEASREALRALVRP